MNGMLKLDEIDIEILTLLHHNGRLSNVSIASSVDLSPPASLHRIRRMEMSGLITHYQAGIDIKKIINVVSVFTEITLATQERSDHHRFEKYLDGVSELMECHLINGEYHYLLRFVARNIGHYQDVIMSLVDAGIGISKYFSYIVISSPVLKKNIPVKSLVLPSDESGMRNNVS